MPKAECKTGTVDIVGNVTVTDAGNRTIIEISDPSAKVTLEKFIKDSDSFTLSSDGQGKVYRDNFAVQTTTVSGEVFFIIPR